MRHFRFINVKRIVGAFKLREGSFPALLYTVCIMADNPQPYTNKYYHNSAKQESLLPTEWLSNDIFGAHHTLSPPSTASLQRMAPTLKTTHINTQE